MRACVCKGVAKGNSTGTGLHKVMSGKRLDFLESFLGKMSAADKGLLETDTSVHRFGRWLFQPRLGIIKPTNSSGVRAPLCCCSRAPPKSDWLLDYSLYCITSAVSHPDPCGSVETSGWAFSVSGQGELTSTRHPLRRWEG